MSDFVEKTHTISDELACSGCGSLLKFKPGTISLACEYCGANNEIASPEVAGKVEEQSLEDFLANNFEEEEQIETTVIKCNACGANSTFDPKISSDKCPFCDTTLVIKNGETKKLHKPQYVLPFGINEQQALSNFKTWLHKLWFAPRDLKHYADRAGKLSGMYLPYWTFDCSTSSSYTGQRGEDYTTTESYQANENGRSVTRTRTVTKTRWYSASGNVSNVFDDLLIEATHSLPQPKLRALEPWDLDKLMPYDDKYLSGFRTETYAVDVKTGYQGAKGRMEDAIYSSVRQDIGGDRQNIFFVNTTYKAPTFKHVLLPVWLSAYKFKNKVYQFMINARTGEVQGDRPYSPVKIGLAIFMGLLIVLLIYLFAK